MGKIGKIQEQLEKIIHHRKSCCCALCHDGAKQLAQAIEKYILDRKPKERKHKCLHHSTRDEDDGGGWCDTCQDTYEGSTCLIYGYNRALKEWEDNLQNGEGGE